MRTLLISLAAALALSTSVARADVYDATQPQPLTTGYVGLSGLGSVDRFFHLGATVDGGFRIASSSFFVHGALSSGVSGEIFARGTYQTVRGGLETRRCIGRPHGLCAFGGLDLGGAFDKVTDDGDHGSGMTTTTRGLLAVPRAGIEIGTTLRARAAIELPIHHELGVAQSSVVGGGLSLGLGYVF